jgi:hypothetical protein
MRRALLLSALLAAAGVIGCGKSGPTQPAQVSAEQERKLKEDQKAVESEEKQHMAQEKKNAPVSDEQKAESEERARQRGR